LSPRELAEVEAEPEGVDEGSIDLHAAVVAEETLLQHRLLHVAVVSRKKKLSMQLSVLPV
jgi:hypothetical protein